MAEYIKREALLTDICDDMCGLKYTGVCENCRVVALIADTPAADVAPVVHGRWIPCKYATSENEDCSNCGYSTYYGNEYDYCPNCGARMDGGANHG